MKKTDFPGPSIYSSIAFKKCADILYDFHLNYRKPKGEDYPSSGGSAMIGAIVTYALSIEIGLKAILYSDGKELSKLKSHDLEKLFHLLNIENQEQIKNNLRNEDFKNYFESELKENNRAFEDWRYYYEKNNKANSAFLKDLSEAIIKHVKK